MRKIGSDYDAAAGITEEYWYEDMTGKLTIKRFQDVDDTLEANKIMFNQHNGANYSDSDGLHHVARIPIMLLEKWYREDGFNWYASSDAERRRKLNDANHRKLLVRPGKL